MSDDLPPWASEDITPEGSTAPVYISKPGANPTVEDNLLTPTEVMAGVATARADGIAALVALGLTEDQAKAIAGV